MESVIGVEWNFILACRVFRTGISAYTRVSGNATLRLHVLLYMSFQTHFNPLQTLVK